MLSQRFTRGFDDDEIRTTLGFADSWWVTQELMYQLEFPLAKLWLAVASRVAIIMVYNVVSTAQEAFHLTVVEGISANVNIPCNLNLETGSLYWEINGLIFDLYSVPEQFATDGYVGLVIPSVHRGMNGWTFQCFTVADARSGFNLGELTILEVIIGKGS